MTVYVYRHHIDIYLYVNYDDPMDCCEPICCAPMTAGAADEMAGMLKALSDPTRLRLLSLIASASELCACDLTEPLGVSQPTVSHHLRVLSDAGLVTRDQRGKWAFYSAREERLRELSDFLDPTAIAQQDIDTTAPRGARSYRLPTSGLNERVLS
jgi:ArsR family transcriptional regulator